MNKKKIFKSLAKLAMENGYEVMLEDKNVDFKSKALGNLANTESLDTGLVLRMYPPETEEREDD